jgi:hypothetical protein
MGCLLRKPEGEQERKEKKRKKSLFFSVVESAEFRDAAYQFKNLGSDGLH